MTSKNAAGKTTRRLLIIGSVFLAICIAASLTAGAVFPAAPDGITNWDSFGKGLNLILFVAVPSGIIAGVCAFAALGTYMIDRQRHGHGK
jgi:hypothetical protein